MIIVTLVATLAAGMVWQQWRAVQVEAAERARTQSAWILSGALDWARLILREDATQRRRRPPRRAWAVPLAEARLSTFLAADKDNNTDDGAGAFLSGAITDAQSRYNLRNLVDATNKIVPRTRSQALKRLCEALGVAERAPTRIAKGLRRLRNAGAGSSQRAAACRKRSSQLAWLGIDAAVGRSARALRRAAAGARHPVNVNTAPREVLLAVIDGIDLGDRRAPGAGAPAHAVQVNLDDGPGRKLPAAQTLQRAERRRRQQLLRGARPPAAGRPRARGALAGRSGVTLDDHQGAASASAVEPRIGGLG